MRVLWDGIDYETLLQNTNLSLSNYLCIISKQDAPVTFGQNCFTHPAEGQKGVSN